MERVRLDVWARTSAELRLKPLGQRWVHSRAVAQRAVEVGEALLLGPSDREVLVAAAYLHDVGYDPQLAVTTGPWTPASSGRPSVSPSAPPSMPGWRGCPPGSSPRR